MSKEKPIIKNIINVIVIVGVVVINIYLICVKSGVPTVCEAMIVVSDRGESLSPKYAPEMIAPAHIAAGMPNDCPMLMSATPNVAIVVHELPVSKEIIEQIITVANRKILGDNILRP